MEFLNIKHTSIFRKRINIAKWDIRISNVLTLVIGIALGVYITLSGLLPKVFATSQGAITFNSSTQFQSGTLSQTQVVGSGTPSNVELAGSGGPSGTKYVVPVTINNTGNSNTLTNYDVSIIVNTQALISAGKMQSACQDIRFTTTSGTNMSYWIEQGCNTTQTKIWVLIPSIPASASLNFDMYYGNSTALSASDGSTTFPQFGNFGGTSLQSSWASTVLTAGCTSTGSVSVSGGALSITNINGSDVWDGSYCATQAYPTSSISGNFVAETIVTAQNNTSSWSKAGLMIENSVAAATSNGEFYLATTPGNGVTDQWQSTGSNVAGDADGSGGSYSFPTYLKVIKNGTSLSGYYGENGMSWTQQGANEIPVGETSSQYVSLFETPHSSSATGVSTFSMFFVRPYSSPEPTTTLGSEGVTLPSSGSWTSPLGSNVINTIWNGGWGDGSTSSSTAFSATVGSVASGQTITFQIKSASTVSGLSGASYYTIGTVSSGTTFSATKGQLDSLGVPHDQYVQVNAEFSQSTGVTPTLSSFTVYYAQDNTPPSPNASAIVMSNTRSGGYNIASGGWDNSAGPYFSWTPGADSQSGMKGYCLYLGTDSNGNPATTKGLLGTSPMSTTGNTCQFITSSTNIDLSQIAYQGSTWLTSSTSPYYFSISAIDNNNNVDTTPVIFKFYYDGTPPVNVSYTSCAGGSFSNIQNMTFSWPTTGSNASSDSYSGILGWQYQINSSTGSWEGTTTDSTLGGIPYIPTGQSSMSLPQSDNSKIIVGSNVIYFRTVSNAGGISSPSTYRTCSINYGGAAPTFATNIGVTINPTTSTTNYYSLSWPAATPATGKSVSSYYYMINTQPPQTLATLDNNPGEYINNGNSTSVSTTSFANVRRGVNTVYVVAIDNSSPPDYSPSNYISGTFTLNSTNPDPVGNLIATDSSIKAQQKWNVTLTWTAPVYQGAGNLQYLIYRSSNNVDFSRVGSTLGLSYVDNTPQSVLYYYYVLVEDGAGAFSSNSYTVSITPTGRYTTPPILEGGPNVSNLTDQSATISWSTNRNGDSKIQYGLSPTNFYQTEPSVPTQVTYHSVTLTNLAPGTTYYYKALWTDTDGNTGTSYESSFTTNPPPEVSGVHATNVSLYSGYVTFSISNAVQATIEYGPTTSYGGTVSISTSPVTSTYSVPLTNLSSGTSYNYRIVMQDSSGNVFYSDNYTDLVTLPAPKITNVRLAQVRDTVIPTVMVTWDSNTPISSIITYWPSGNTSQMQNKINITLQKGTHQMFLQGLNSKTTYNLVVKGVDKMGNQASSYTQTFTTATNTMPPLITGLNVQGEVSSSSSSNDQLVVSWTTDTPSTSQGEFGVGAGSSYPQKTQEST
ncbi:MAG: DUF2341 domain-containing protein, partial [Patescibacteria group bacterium]